MATNCGRVSSAPRSCHVRSGLVTGHPCQRSVAPVTERACQVIPDRLPRLFAHVTWNGRGSLLGSGRL